MIQQTDSERFRVQKVSSVPCNKYLQSINEKLQQYNSIYEHMKQ